MHTYAHINKCMYHTVCRYIGAVTRAQDVLLAPSAFMPTTGKAHWEVGRAYT